MYIVHSMCGVQHYRLCINDFSALCVQSSKNLKFLCIGAYNFNMDQHFVEVCGICFCVLING